MLLTLWLPASRFAKLFQMELHASTVQLLLCTLHGAPCGTYIHAFHVGSQTPCTSPAHLVPWLAVANDKQ